LGSGSGLCAGRPVHRSGFAAYRSTYTSAFAPPSQSSATALGLRLAISAVVLLRLTWTLQPLLARGGLAYLLFLALAVLGLCGAGFWWLEPTVHTLTDGLWLAFTTAATVGYGDIVPTSLASKIFSVFVVLLGLGVLTTVTAAIAASWVETEERRIEREILHDLRSQLDSVRAELKALRAETRSAAMLQAERDERSKR
jgi:voltage-gated potassium channel